jgi:hypothetical protein
MMLNTSPNVVSDAFLSWYTVLKSLRLRNYPFSIVVLKCGSSTIDFNLSGQNTNEAINNLVCIPVGMIQIRQRSPHQLLNPYIQVPEASGTALLRPWQLARNNGSG